MRKTSDSMEKDSATARPDSRPNPNRAPEDDPEQDPDIPPDPDTDPGPPATAVGVRRYLHWKSTRKGAWWFSKAVYRATERFLMDDGLYMASALAFSLVLAIFPFIIFVTALAGFIGGPQLAGWLTNALFETMPDRVAQALEPEIWNVLIRDAGGGLLTFSLLVMLISVSGAVETVRGGLNRAYGLPETRSLFRTRLESIVFVILTTIALTAIAFAAVVAPIAFATIPAFVPNAVDIYPTIEVLQEIELFRELFLAVVLSILLYALHLVLPDYEAKRPQIWPGILATLFLWWVAARAFSWYLASFANYAKIYAGLAGIVAALIFFYLASTILLFAGALNRAIFEAWQERRAERNAKAKAKAKA